MADDRARAWPELPFAAWRETRDDLHMWTQIVGKIRLALAPPMNEWWQVPLYVNARGLGTSPMPVGRRVLEIDFDLVDHNLLFRTSEGETRALALVPRPTCVVFDEIRWILDALDVEVHVDDRPCELAEPIRFSEDRRSVYDPAWARRFHRVLVGCDRVFKEFRAGYAGKSSPVHFFWGAFDLAVSRFSGKPVRPAPGTDRMNRIAYDEEVVSLGFWPGTAGMHEEAAFYAYAKPEPPGFRAATIPVPGARWHEGLGEFLLPYEAVRTSADPEGAILAFARATWEAASELGGWDRGALERPLDPWTGTAEGAALH